MINESGDRKNEKVVAWTGISSDAYVNRQIGDARDRPHVFRIIEDQPRRRLQFVPAL
ncbi:MAG: hypothetical protein MK103_01035 [Planctomycetes bacterium]|nr:hypothetical protein [Planctomycetota bacterium]